MLFDILDIWYRTMIWTSTLDNYVMIAQNITIAQHGCRSVNYCPAKLIAEFYVINISFPFLGNLVY